MSSAENGAVVKSPLRIEAETNISRRLIRSSRLVKACVILGFLSGFAGQHEKEVAPAVAVSGASMLIAGEYGRRSQKYCKREVDAYAVNVVHGQDPFDDHPRVMKRTLSIRHGKLEEDATYDHVAGFPSGVPMLSARFSAFFAPGVAWGAGVITDAIYSGNIAPGSTGTVAYLEGVMLTGVLMTVGLSSKAWQYSIYNRQLDNIDGPQGIEQA